MNDVWGLLIFFGSGLSLLMALAGFRRSPVLQSLLYALIGCLLFEFFLTHSLGWMADMELRPVQTEAFLFIRCAKYSLGPLFYAFYLQLTTYRTPRSFLAHFLPQAAAWGLSLAYMASSMAGWPSFGTFRTVMGVCTDASLLHLLIYVLYALLSARTSGNRKAFAAMLGITVVCGAVVAMLVLYLATGWKALEIGSQVLLTVAMVVHFLQTQLRPGSLERFGQDFRRKDYQRSLLAGVDKELLALRLRDLMEKEKIFTDELLTLEGLAERLSIPRNHLSEFLNGELQTNFSAYVNRFRVEEAQRLLLDHPERSILSQAFAAGFNSKSVFYETFKRFAGMAPQEYRESRQVEPTTVKEPGPRRSGP